MAGEKDQRGEGRWNRNQRKGAEVRQREYSKDGHLHFPDYAHSIPGKSPIGAGPHPSALDRTTLADRKQKGRYDVSGRFRNGPFSGA